jgi:transposase, IS5 family
MEGLMPWAEFCVLIEPHYPKAGNEWPQVGLERMLRMYLANWFNLSDEACEGALCDVPVFREFCRIDIGCELVLDAIRFLKFRHLLEGRKLAALFAKLGELLLANRVKLSGGTIVDATLIATPPSIKNEDKNRDPEMYQTKKDNEWHVGTKLHIGADSRTGLIHSATTAAVGAVTKEWGVGADIGALDCRGFAATCSMFP